MYGIINCSSCQIIFYLKKMFTDKVFVAEGFDSSWRNEKETSNQSAETTEFKTKDQASSTSASISTQTQTENNHSEVIEDVDMNRLAAWLKAICPHVMDELKDVTVSNATASLNLDDEHKSVTGKFIQLVQVVDKEFYVSAISWNSTGNTLAVSCCTYHTTWCHHQGVVHLYTFGRDQNLPLIPTKKLNCESCVTSVSFHPEQPSILCAGTYSGEIYLWNNQNDEGDCLIAMDASHEDQVTQIKWVKIDPKIPIFVLASASQDGHLYIWDINVNENILQVKTRYTLGKTHKTIANNEMFKTKTEGGIVQFDFSSYILGTFVVGLEGGILIKCTIVGAKALTNDKKGSTFDPSVNKYEEHNGEILSIKFCPHRKDLFLTCGNDNEIKIFNIDQVVPTQVIFIETELNCVSWIPNIEKLLVGCGTNGTIRVYSLLNGLPIPSAYNSCKIDFGKLTVNHKNINIVVFGNNEGQIQLWNIPWNNIAIRDYNNLYGKKDYC